MLIDNTLFLRERFPEVRHYFRDYEDELKTDHITVLDSKKGSKTIRYETDENNHLMVHSLYDPVREAERIISTHKDKIEKDTHVFFYGIGMGYHIERFHELFPENSYSIYEPIPEIFSAMAEYKLLDQIITNKTEKLYIDKHDAEVNGHLLEFNTSNRNIHLIILPSYENIIKEKLEHFRDNIKKTILNRRTSLHTNANFQKRWVMNSLMNFKEVLNTPNILRDIDCEQFAGKPAIIVSAGPSLAEDIEHLRYIKENNLAYLFAVGSAINSLIEYDVMPDAVCTYDPGEKNHLVFKKMIVNNIDDIPMLFGSSVGHETLTNYNGPKAHFITSQDRTSLYFLEEQLEFKDDLIIDSPSIAVMTFQVLNKLGASPIIFAGQNLGYLHDRRYADGIEYDFIQSEVTEKEMEKAETTTDVYGNKIKTNIVFNNMRIAIEQHAKLNGGRYVNTTKGGAAIEGVPFQPIEGLIEEALEKPIEKHNWWVTQNHYGQDEIENQFENLKKNIEEYHHYMKQFEKVLKSISMSVKIRNKSNTNLALTQFDNLYNSLVENPYYKNFLSFYIRVHVEYLGNEIKQLNMEKDIFVKGEEIVRVFSGFMEQCVKATEELERLINNSLENLAII